MCAEERFHCNDNVDNDNNSFVDCADKGCRNDPVCSLCPRDTLTTWNVRLVAYVASSTSANFFAEIERLLANKTVAIIGQQDVAFLNYNDGKPALTAAQFSPKALLFPLPFTAATRTQEDMEHFAFSATATITLPVRSNYSFAINSDDGVRLKVDNQTCLDANAPQSVAFTFCTVRYNTTWLE